jgi:tetratricopeptide (TPR) repeat protein
LAQQYTSTEVARMLEVKHSQLAYWARLRLVAPRARWGERFYSFADLVALETIKRLTRKGVPARRLRRAIEALESQLGEVRTPLARLRVITNGRQVVVHAPGPGGKPIEPLTGQFVLQFETAVLVNKVRAMASRSAEEWFEIGLACDTAPETLPMAAEAYQHALEQAPDWMEAHVNLGTVLYELQRLEEARAQFEAAIALEPSNPLTHFNLACVLEPLGDLEGAIERLHRALALSPRMADAHLNLALAYEKTGRDALARKHLTLYLQTQPQGPWAEYARARVRPEPAAGSRNKVTPFRRNG